MRGEVKAPATEKKKRNEKNDNGRWLGEVSLPLSCFSSFSSLSSLWGLGRCSLNTFFPDPLCPHFLVTA